MSRKLLWIVPVAAVLGVAWYLFRPELLWLSSTVAESLDDAAALGDSTAASAMPIALLHGRFRGVHHDGAGTATVLRLADGTRVLRLTEFVTDNGPDLYVYLVASTDAADNETVERAGYVSLGRLKGNQGDQNYVIPSELDLSSYRAVSIWCKRFGVNFAAAALSDIMSDTNTANEQETVEPYHPEER